MSGVAILVVTDGRDDYLGQTISALEANVTGPITERWMFDDVGNERHVRRLAGWYPSYHVFSAGRRLGFGGAISYAWNMLAEASTAEYIGHWEDDFVPTRPVDLTPMIDVLTVNPHLAQMALRRQPVNDQERVAGGVVEQHPGDYLDVTAHNGTQWLEHRRYFTTNPSLYRRELCAAGWQEGQHSEGHYGIRLLERGLPWGIPGDQVRFALWGARTDPPWVEHIGDVRVGTGY